MEQQRNQVEVKVIPNEKLAELQRHLAAIASGEQRDVGGATPDTVGIEGMYNIHQALRRARGRRPGTEELTM